MRIDNLVGVGEDGGEEESGAEEGEENTSISTRGLGVQTQANANAKGPTRKENREATRILKEEEEQRREAAKQKAARKH